MRLGWLTPYSLSYVFQDHLDWFTYRDGTRISHTEYSELERTYKGHRVQHPSCFHNYNKHNFCQIFWALKILHFLIFETYICSVWNLLNIYLLFYQNITSLAFFLWFFLIWFPYHRLILCTSMLCWYSCGCNMTQFAWGFLTAMCWYSMLISYKIDQRLTYLLLAINSMFEFNSLPCQWFRLVKMLFYSVESLLGGCTGKLK